MTDRTKFLLSILALLVLALSWVVWKDTSQGGGDGVTENIELAREWQPLPTDLKPLMAEELKAQTGIEILAARSSFTAPGGKVSGTAPSAEAVRSTALMAANELQRYPPSYLAATGLRTIVLAKEIKGGGRTWGGLASPGNRAFLMSTEFPDEIRRQTLHHEIFHLFDRTLYDLTAWKALNPPGFEYDPKEALIPDPGSGNGIDRTLYAFITRYAMFNANEDRAELFAWLFTDQPSVLDVASHDRVLTAKIARLKADVIARVPEMDERFWAAH